MSESLPPPSSNPPTEALAREMRDRAREMFEHALAECSIPRAFSKQVVYDRGELRLGDDVYVLESFSRTLVVSIGKAGHTMAEALADTVGTGLAGIIACPNPPPAQLFGFRYFLGGHPLPNEDSLRAGTDGIDGNSDAAGAVADGTTAERARQRGLDIATALMQLNASPLFDAIGDSIMTGPTGNNVRDLRILMAY